MASAPELGHIRRMPSDRTPGHPGSTGLFTDQAAKQASDAPRPELRGTSRYGGTRWESRGATWEGNKGDHIWVWTFPGHPMDGMSCGNELLRRELVDLWHDGQRLPHYMRAVPKDDRSPR